MALRTIHSWCCTNINLEDGFVSWRMECSTVTFKHEIKKNKAQRRKDGKPQLSPNEKDGLRVRWRETQREGHKESHHHPNWNRCFKSQCLMQHMALFHLSSCTHTHTHKHTCFYTSVHIHMLNEPIYTENVFPLHCLCLQDWAVHTESHNSLWPDDSSADCETENKERWRREHLKLGCHNFLCILLMCVSEVAVHWYWFPQGWLNMPILLLWPIKPLW